MYITRKFVSSVALTCMFCGFLAGTVFGIGYTVAQSQHAGDLRPEDKAAEPGTTTCWSYPS